MLTAMVDTSLLTISTSLLSAASCSLFLSVTDLGKSIIHGKAGHVYVHHFILLIIRVVAILAASILMIFDTYPVGRITSGESFIGQDFTWLSNSCSFPWHSHSLSTIRSDFTSFCISLLIFVLHSDALHKGHVFPSPSILLTASSERLFPQHDVRWGQSITQYTTGQ